MSWSLQIAHGDLVFGTNGLNTVTGGSKLTQDLRCALLTPTGTDSLHPTFGSVMDGGIDANGNTVQGVIGSPNNDVAAAFVQAEVQRVVRVYQSQQIARNKADISIYGKSTLTADEALLSLRSLTMQQVADEILIEANLETGTGGLPLAVPFSTT